MADQAASAEREARAHAIAQLKPALEYADQAAADFEQAKVTELLRFAHGKDLNSDTVMLILGEIRGYRAMVARMKHVIRIAHTPKEPQNVR